MFDDLRLYLLFTPELCVADPWALLEQALRGGVDLVQWRTPGRSDPEGLAECLRICGGHDVPVIVNDDIDLAVRLGAFGAHVGQGDLPAAEARRRLAPRQVLGVSTHSMAELERALEDGADHVGFGPMFPTDTKGYREGQPAGALTEIAQRSPVPVFPIGGITVDRVARLRTEGVRRAAVSTAILRSPEPERTARDFARALSRDEPRDGGS